MTELEAGLHHLLQLQPSAAVHLHNLSFEYRDFCGALNDSSSLQVMESAAAKLTPVVLELGGKDPFIVCDDADLNQVNN